jgi:hypothetical protein
MKRGDSIHRMPAILALAAFFLLSLPLAAAESPANTSFTNATVLGGSYFELIAAPKTNELGVVDASVPAEYWWKWTAPKSGRVSLRAKTQTPYDALASKTLVSAWPEPTYDATNGWPSDSVVTLRSSSIFDLFFSERHVGGGTQIWLNVPPEGTLSIFEGVDSSSFNPVSEWSLPLEKSYFGAGDVEATSFFVQKGLTYSIRALIGSKPQSVTILFTPTPTNDQFATRSILTGVEAAAEGNNFAGTLKANQPLASDDAAGRTVWWTWTPPTAGNLSVKFTGDKMVLGVFRGDSIGSLERIMSLTPPEPDPWAQAPNGVGEPRTLIPVQAGVPLQFAIDSAGSGSGFDYSVKLSLEFLPPAIDAGRSHRLDDGSFLLRAQQLRGRDVALYSSTDLVNWKAIWRGIVNGDEVSFQDLDAKWSEQTFYSIRLTPSEHLQYPSAGPDQAP